MSENLFDLLAMIVYYPMVWTIPFGLQWIIIPMGPDRWNKFIDSQFAKDPSKVRIDAFYAYACRFVMYSFQYPFIHKRATSQLKIFKVYKVLMWFNAFWIYSLIGIAILAKIGEIYGYISLAD